MFPYRFQFNFFLTLLLLTITTVTSQHDDDDDDDEDDDHFHVHDGGLDDWDDDTDPEEDDDYEPENVIQREKFIHNVEHMKAHMKEDHVEMDANKMSKAELDYHFFKEHDTNGDSKLDGLELLRSILDGLDEQFDKIAHVQDEAAREKKRMMYYTKAWLSVDRILADGDKNNDGYLTYTEFKQSRSEEMSKQMHKPLRGRGHEQTENVKF